MTFACTQENLLQGLQMVSHVGTKNVNLPILSNVLLKTEAGSLKLSATNLEMAVNCTVRGRVDREGEYSVPAKLFLDYVSLLPSGKIELELKEEGLEVRSTEQETVLRGAAASEFPLLPKVATGGGFNLTMTDAKRAISQVGFAVSNSDSRPELSGVAVFATRGTPGTVLFVATDSYRLAERTISSSVVTADVRTIVPARAMAEIGRILGAYNDELEGAVTARFVFSENQLVVTCGTVELVTRLIDGSFPDYIQIIPKTFQTDIVLARQEFQKAVRAASLFAKTGVYDIHVAVSTDGCVVRSNEQETGKTRTLLKGSVTGPTNEVTLNFKYVSDGLGALGTDSVHIHLIDAMSPVLLTPAGDTGYRYIVMPIRQ